MAKKARKTASKRNQRTFETAFDEICPEPLRRQPMSENARPTTTGQERHTAKTVFALIKSLPPAERRKFFDLVAKHPENRKGNAWWYVIAISKSYKEINAMEAEAEMRLREEKSIAEATISDLEYELGNRIPKRKMTAANQETLDNYRKLLKKHGNQRGGQMKALKELVTLPSEQSKSYVVKYRESCQYHPESIGDIESVRQHVKRLRTTDRKRR